jgi:hypothetical protein
MAFHPVLQFREAPEEESFTRVAPSVPCVERAGSTAERQSGEVTAATRKAIAREARVSGARAASDNWAEKQSLILYALTRSPRITRTRARWTISRPIGKRKVGFTKTFSARGHSGDE